MTYAIISDIHGNYPALTATLDDAKAHGADMYLLLGDHTNRFPWANEIIDELRNLSPAHIIRGNGEDYYTDLQHVNKEDMTDAQFKSVYWAYNLFTPENLAYLLSLPETITISHVGTGIHLAHSIDLFYRPSVVGLFHTINFHNMMMTSPITHREYLARGREALLACPEAMADIRALPGGIYLFGHNHLQFHTEIEGRIFINPGSCGLPADWDTTAPYILLSYENGRWTVSERRVKYDLNTVIEGIDASGFSAYTPAFSQVLKLQLLSGKEYVGAFITHVLETRKRLDPTVPRNEAWDIAVKTWDANNLGYITWPG